LIINVYLSGMEELITTQNIELDAIIKQIKKDLTLSGIDTNEFDNITTANQLVTALKSLVSEMLTYRFEDFNRFMYRIDIPEHQLSNILHRDLTLLVEELCVIILKREIQKIVFRQQFGT